MRGELCKTLIDRWSRESYSATRPLLSALVLSKIECTKTRSEGSYDNGTQRGAHSAYWLCSTVGGG